MHFTEAIGIALDTLRTHKLRSFLTLLGVIISVCTLVVVVALVEGVNAYVGDKIAGLGSNTFSVDQFSLNEMTDLSQYMEAKKRNPPIRLAEYELLLGAAHLPQTLAAKDTHGNGTIKDGGRTLQDVQVQGVTPNELALANFQVAAGRYILPVDESHRRDVAFLGPDVVSHLFGGGNPLGRQIDVDGHQFEVVGVATPQGNIFGQSQDNFVVLPLSTFQKVYGTQDSLEINVQARSPELLPATMDEVEMLMRAERHVPWDQKDTFGLIGSDALMSLWNTLTGAIAAVMVGVSIVFLVVGGIVIMNIMLAAVTERTREVGTRKALGARRSDILRQFLVESAVLATAGGLAGVAVAYLFTLVAARLTPIPFSLPWVAVAVAIGISTLVGLFFGIYPASRAAKLPPVVALRAEL